MARAVALRKVATSPRIATKSILHPATACHTCPVQPRCVPGGFEPELTHEFEQLLGHQLRVRKGKPVYRIGDKFEALFAIRSGSFKTVFFSEDGYEQITGYRLPAEVIGTDGIHNEIHREEAIALEDSVVCPLSFDELERLAVSRPALQRSIHRLLSREVARDHRSMLMLGSMRAEQRLVSFLLDLAARYQALGYSSSEFLLRMTREEIGNLLGLKLETISRLFSYLHREGMIQSQGRNVKILDGTALQLVMSGDGRKGV
jgi:CRP/FNR family transcriptional regulator